MNLHDAFTVNIQISFSGNPKKKKKKKMVDAYESFLRGNWGKLNKRQMISKLSDLKPRTFGSLGG